MKNNVSITFFTYTYMILISKLCNVKGTLDDCVGVIRLDLTSPLDEGRKSGYFIIIYELL